MLNRVFYKEPKTTLFLHLHPWVYLVRQAIVVNFISNPVCFNTGLFRSTDPDIRSMVGHNCMSIKPSSIKVGILDSEPTLCPGLGLAL